MNVRSLAVLLLKFWGMISVVDARAAVSINRAAGPPGAVHFRVRLSRLSGNTLADMNFSLASSHLDYPMWVKIWLVLTMVYPFVVVPLLRRATRRSARWFRTVIPVTALPVAVAIAVCFMGLRRIAAGLSLPGAGYHAAAAGAAEAQAAARLGSISSLIVALSLLYLLQPGRVSRSASLLLASSVLLFAAQLWFAWYLSHPDLSWSRGLMAASNTGVVVASVAVLTHLSFMVVPPLWGDMSTRPALTVSAVIFASLTVCSWWAMDLFRTAAVIWG